MNWDDARVLIALSRSSSLRAASRTLGMDQATVGRRISALECSLSAKLFFKTTDGYVLTSSGEAAMESALEIEKHVLTLQRRVQGTDERLQGVVRVTATDSIAQDFLVPAVARVHLKHPDVQVQIHSSTVFLSLARRETDIALRNVKPDNPDLITRCLAKWTVGLFASPEYLERMGEPQPGAAFAEHDLVIYQPYLDNNKNLHLVGEPITQGKIAAAVSSSLLVRNCIVAGVGLGELPVALARGHNLTRVWPNRSNPQPYSVWLVTHGDLRHTARVRAVIEELVAVFHEPSIGECV